MITTGERAGEPLFPEMKPLDFLLEQRKLLTEGSWQALYEQSPFIIGGGIFPIEKLKTLPVLDRSKILKSVRYWDKGGTEGGGAFTAGALLHKMRDNTFIIEHVVRGQWSALQREEKIRFWAEHDAKNARPGAYEVGVEQEPGSGGKESAESTIRNLRGFKVYADKVTGSKEVRAEPFAAQVQGGNVSMVAGIWQADLLDEMQSFPNGKYRDQVDACSGAFNRLVSGPIYNLFGGAVDRSPRPGRRVLGRIQPPGCGVDVGSTRRRGPWRETHIGLGSATSSRLLLHYDRTVVSSMTLSIETLGDSTRVRTH
jgi:predicted phage terminase large subunit-like protein